MSSHNVSLLAQSFRGQISEVGPSEVNQDAHRAAFLSGSSRGERIFSPLPASRGCTARLACGRFLCLPQWAHRKHHASTWKNSCDYTGALTNPGSSCHSKPVSTHNSLYQIIPYHTTPPHTIPQHTTLLHTIPYYTILLHTTPHKTTQHTPQHTIPHHSILSHTTLLHTIPYPAIPHHTTPYHITPYHTISYHTIPHHSQPHTDGFFMLTHKLLRLSCLD